jgi:hypothetical protein
MKRKIIFLCTLASASAALILPSISGERLQIQPVAKSKIEVPAKYYAAVQNQVLQHLNPKVPIAQRFSRTLRPMSSKYYDSEIVSHSKDGITEFNVRHIDRSDPKKPKTAVFASGKFNSKTNEVFLVDAATGKYVPALEHPLIRKGATS